VAPRGRGRRPPDREQIHALLCRYAATRDPEARERLVEAFGDLALYLARKFGNRGEPLEDIVQVARIGLLKALERYDPAREVEFTTYATPTIVGEIRRHFRDKLWAIRVPRGLRERNAALMRAIDDLAQRLGRSPTIQELSEHTGVALDDVLEALEVGRAYSLISLDAEGPEGEGESVSALAESVGAEDPALEGLEDRATLEGALARLPARSREIVRLRFFEDLSQADIAARLGISQMHVSRLLREALLALRVLLAEEGDSRAEP
jgi:RNA polymerase sigma-B factor